ncbi:PREDICTED: myb-like protein X [Camelina sativa]|uniref:Myb-like protein X n=1 Tax=Camelina sativa TaxID=90675 RepID=A0ABM1QR96_CAMSA|nr:PREDICTED: myb-like protein X [Camelina sativa]
MKKVSSRSQRGSKGIKGKHVLQICVLLGVCIWLIYQVKYSHDKKKEFYEKDGEKSTVLLSEVEDGVVKLGRKDLLPGYHSKKEKHVEEDEDEDEISHGGKEKKSKVEEEKEEEEEEVVEEDEEDKNKQGEEVAEEDEEENKHEEDEIDEQDQNKTVGDTDKDDETLEEEKESGTSESDEKEKEKETTHADEIDMTVDEAREEHYKADDASSAVSHESRILNTEKLKESSNETAQENNSNSTTSGEVEIQKQPELKLGEADVVNKTTTEVKDGDSEPSSSVTKSAVTESLGETVNTNSTEAILEATGFLQNETKIMQDRSQEKNAPPAVFSEPHPVLELEQIRNEFDPNTTVSANITNKDTIQDESRNSTSESLLIENISGSNTTEVKENSRSEGDDESAEKESSNVFSTELTEEADNTSETSISQEEMDALTDTQTLPDIRIEGNEEEEEEAIGTE